MDRRDRDYDRRDRDRERDRDRSRSPDAGRDRDQDRDMKDARDEEDERRGEERREGDRTDSHEEPSKGTSCSYPSYNSSKVDTTGAPNDPVAWIQTWPSPPSEGEIVGP